MFNKIQLFSCFFKFKTLVFFLLLYYNIIYIIYKGKEGMEEKNNLVEEKNQEELEIGKSVKYDATDIQVLEGLEIGRAHV